MLLQRLTRQRWALGVDPPIGKWQNLRMETIEQYYIYEHVLMLSINVTGISYIA